MRKAVHLFCLLLAVYVGGWGCDPGPREAGPPNSLTSTSAPPQQTDTELTVRTRVQELRAKFLDPSATTLAREEAAVELASTHQGGNVLLSLASQAKIPAELMPAVSEAIFRNPDVTVRALASEHFQRPSRSGQAFPPVQELVQMPANAARGKQVFFGDAAGCSRCHSHAGKGGDFGPDLTQVHAKLPRDTIFDAVLNPSASVMFGYEGWLIETQDGESYTGFILSDDETVVLKTGPGESVSIPAADIVLRQRQCLSLMPDNITIGLTPQELADLVEFLGTPVE